MRFPNKITPFAHSSIAKFPDILNLLQVNELSLEQLYQQVKNIRLNEFIEILDCLFALNKINYNNETRRLSYVTSNK